MNVFHHIAPTTAAACCLLGASTALPTYPDNVPWPSWVSWSAMAAVFASYWVWFYVVGWAVGRARRIRQVFVRTPLYIATFLAASAVSLVPLLPAYGIFGLCWLGVDCGSKFQGAFNVLHAASFELRIWVSIPICIVFICTAIVLSRRLYGHQDAAPPFLQVDA